MVEMSKQFPKQLAELINTAERRGLTVDIHEEVTEWDRVVRVKVGMTPDTNDIVSILDSFETVWMTATLRISTYATNRWRINACYSNYGVPLEKITQTDAIKKVRFGFYNAKVGA